MTILAFTVVVAIVSFVAGLLGSLTGLGGGVVLVPLLTIFFHVDIRYAIGASLVSVIATSSGAAAAYVKEGFSNIRIGMFLEIATTFGALCGAFLATRLPPSPAGWGDRSGPPGCRRPRTQSSSVPGCCTRRIFRESRAPRPSATCPRI